MDSTKTEFRKPSNDAGGRKYRRRSPIDGSSSESDGSPRRTHGSAAKVSSRNDVAKDADDKRRESDDMDGDYKSGRGGESRKHSSRSYHRYDDHSRRDRRVDDHGRGYSKSSYHSGREKEMDYSRGDRDFHSGDSNKYRGKSDGSGSRIWDKDSNDKAGYSRRHNYVEDKDRDSDRVRHIGDRGGRDGKSDRDHKLRSPPYQESRGHQDERPSGKDSRHHSKEASQKEVKGLDGDRYANEDKGRFNDRDNFKQPHNKEQKEQLVDDKVFSSRNQDSVAKKPKLSGWGSAVPEKNNALEKDFVTDSDIDAAKIAAMKAAELVNKNLVGTGYMSTDQKKKLLWGNKKTTTTEESAHRWDSTTFGDRDRQEKFNKLMSLRLHWYIWPIVGCEGRSESGAQARQPGRGEAARAASNGIGETIHSRIASKRWSNCGTWSIRLFVGCLCARVNVFGVIFLYCVKNLFCEIPNVHRTRICWSLFMACYF